MSHHLWVLSLQGIHFHLCPLQCRLPLDRDNQEDQEVQMDQDTLVLLLDHGDQEAHRDQEDPSPQRILRRREEVESGCFISSPLAPTEN